MFATNAQDEVRLPTAHASRDDVYWRELRIAGGRPCFYLRLRTLWPTVRFDNVLVALDEDVAVACATPGRELLSLTCLFPAHRHQVLGASCLPFVEIWRAEDRYDQLRPTIMFVTDEGKVFGGDPFTCRDGLRRVRLVARVSDSNLSI